MCGFIGFLDKNRDYDGDSIIEQMIERIRHRGPDSQRHYVDDEIALGFARLSIIDEANGVQPMGNEEGMLELVFNGEIYNYLELKKELIDKGHTFATDSDTEVLLHGFEEYGNSLPSKLRGMFSFVIWDKVNKKVFGCRDHFGIKPFYYCEINGGLLFGSEIKGFLPHPRFVKKFNEQRLPDYLTFSCVPGYDTFFEGVYKLKPGHYFEYADGYLNVVKYFDNRLKIDHSKNEKYFVDKIKDTLEESVSKHLISDFEVGCFLSSGVDSSFVTSEVRKHQEVKTYSLGYADEKYNEAALAKAFSEEIGAENRQVIISAEDYFNSVGKVQYHLDEPLANPSANLLYLLSQRAAMDLKVVLSGEGADEMFGGYNVYKEPFVVNKYKRVVPKGVRKALANFVKDKKSFKGKDFLTRGNMTIEERYIGNSNLFRVSERDSYLAKKYDSKLPGEYTKPFYDAAKDLDDVSKMQYLDINVWMVQEILLKADKMSMANSLELRVPLLDKEVFEVARTIPTKFKVDGKQTKLAFRKVAEQSINMDSASRTKKAFPLPLVEWIREDRYYELIKSYLLSETAKTFFNNQKVIELLEKHKNGEGNYARKIWAIFTFLVWYEQFFGNEVEMKSE
ncbi:MAG: asparagine synthase (glutamine-hydrolyzing) [Anaerovoracaceae bacterium]